jgi:hypothetical protein
VSGNIDPAAAYRKEFLNVLARLDLEPTRAIALVEAATARPFDSCAPTQLLALLHLLLEILRAPLIRVEGGPQ